MLRASSTLLLRRYGKRQCQASISTAGTMSEEDETAAAFGKSNATKIDPRPIFPWRHSDEYLPRLSPGPPQDIVLPRNGERMMAALFLDDSFLEVFLSDSWSRNLSEDATFAFSQAVAGIVSNVYSVPFDDINTEEGFRFTFPESGENETETKVKERQCTQVSAMVSPDLRDLFRSAHDSGYEQLEVTLETKPVRNNMYALFCVPFVSREHAMSRPEKVDEMVNYMRILRSSPTEAITGFNKLLEEQMIETGGKMTTSVDLQVVVQCEEAFRVRDRETGAVLQGTEDAKPQSVLHLARFEREVSWSASEDSMFANVERANWVLTDIDDLLGEDKWYHRIRDL